MFTVKADIARLAIGYIIFVATSFWLFEFVGAALMLLAMANFAIHICAPQVIKQAEASFTTQYPSDPVAQAKQLALIRGDTETFVLRADDIDDARKLDS